MTAKHRKGKSNHKQDDNFFKNEVMETEVRAGGNNYTLLLVLNAIILIGGATCAWFCFQQHQTLTYLTDNLMGIQMKIVKLQSFHEEMRQSKSKQPMSESMETRLTAIEESYALTQKQVGIALGTAEQLKKSDLPTQVLSLHAEMKARLAEMQQATVSVEQLSQLQRMLKGKSEEFEDVRTQLEGLATLNGELFQKAEAVTGSLGEVESKLEEKNGQIATLSATLNGQATEVLRLKDQLDKYQSRLEASILEMARVRELLENEQSQQLQQANVEEQLNTLVGETQPPAEPLEQMEEETAAASGKEDAEEGAATGEEGVAAATEEEDTETAASAVEEETVEATEEEQSLPAGEEEGASSPEEENTQADEQEEAPVEQEDSETEETVPEEKGETQQEEPVAESEKEDVDATQTEEETVEEENREDDDEEVQEESAPEEESQGAAGEDEEAEGDEGDEAKDVMESEGEEELRDVEEEGEEEQQDVAADEEPQEAEEEEESLEDDALPEDE